MRLTFSYNVASSIVYDEVLTFSCIPSFLQTTVDKFLVYAEMIILSFSW